MVPVGGLMASVVVAPGRLVSKKLAGAVTPDTEAVTAYEPAAVFAVKLTLAKPFTSVLTVELPTKLPLGPLVGAANITVAPLTGLPNASWTFATSGLPNAIPTVVLWPEPEKAVIDAGEPAATITVKFWLASGGTPFVALITIG